MINHDDELGLQIVDMIKLRQPDPKELDGLTSRLSASGRAVFGPILQELGLPIAYETFEARAAGLEARVQSGRLLLTRFKFDSGNPIWSSFKLERFLDTFFRVSGNGKEHLCIAVADSSRAACTPLTEDVANFLDQLIRNTIRLKPIEPFIEWKQRLFREPSQSEAEVYWNFWVRASFEKITAVDLSSAVSKLHETKAIVRILDGVSPEMANEEFRREVRRELAAFSHSVHIRNWLLKKT